MGGETPISGLSFDILLEILPTSGIWWEFLANIANWIKTNLKGMTFGVLFGAAALTLLPLLKTRSFRNGFANSALGAAIGAPLGVCVNCAAPIALGLHQGRMRLETTLSALLASPTLNVIVVTMSFTLLPLHLAVIKLVLALVTVLLVIPLLCRYLLVRETELTRNRDAQLAALAKPAGFSALFHRLLPPMDAVPGTFGPLQSLGWFAKGFARNFLFIFAITVPMMLLAAVLGAVVASFTDPNEIALYFSTKQTVRVLALMGMTALVASFVPAPIALDVILTTILLGIGMRPEFAMVALIGLGSFSVYAFIILWRGVSLRTAVSLWCVVVGMAVLGGLIAKWSQPMMLRHHEAQKQVLLDSAEPINWPVPPPLARARTLAELAPVLDAQTVPESVISARIETDGSGSVAIFDRALTAQRQWEQASVDAAVPRFGRVAGNTIGLDEQGVVTPLREFAHNFVQGGIAAGDIHGDGWIDIIVRRPAGATGLSLYANTGGRFVRQELALGVVDTVEVFNYALVDLDGDGLLDLYVSTNWDGDFLFYNQGGTFGTDDMVQVIKPDTATSAALGFADMDQDGDIDIIAGRWAPRGIREMWRLMPLQSRNRVLWNEGDRTFSTEVIQGIPGQTLSTVIADFDHDGWLDMFSGDDNRVTDRATFFDKGRTLRPYSLDTQPFPYLTTTTMSIDQGDWNNDLRDDYYLAQVAAGDAPTGAMNPLRAGENRVIHAICSQFGADAGWDQQQIRDCSADLLSIDLIRGGHNGRKLDGCQGPSQQQHRVLCAAVGLFDQYANTSRNFAGDVERHQECSKALARFPVLQRYCASILTPTDGPYDRELLKRIYRPALHNGNILMSGAEDGTFIDLASEAGVRRPGWSWNARFADLDQDGWQDILVMTGIWYMAASSTSNTFYHNNRNGFSSDAGSFGFEDIVPSYSYATLDYDRDGDVDVIRDMSAMQMIVHRNDRPAGPALVVNLRDSSANTMGIGARVYVCVDGEDTVRPGKCQMRVIKASGGFMSADPIAAHFGLGAARSVSLIEVHWPDGETSTLRPENLPSGEVVIRRTKH